MDAAYQAASAPIGLAAIVLDNTLAVLPFVVDITLSILIVVVLFMAAALYLRSVDFLPIPVPCKGCEKVSDMTSWAIVCKAGTGEGTATCGAVTSDMMMFKKMMKLLRKVEESMKKIREFFANAMRLFQKAYFSTRMFLKNFEMSVMMVGPKVRSMMQLPDIPDVDLGSCNVDLTWVPFADLGEIDICKALADGINAIINGLETALNMIGIAIGTVLSLVMEPFRILLSEVNFGLTQFAIDMGDVFGFLRVMQALVMETNILMSAMMKLDAKDMCTRGCLWCCNRPCFPFWYGVMQFWPSITEALDPFPLFVCFGVYCVALFLCLMYGSICCAPVHICFKLMALVGLSS